MEKLLRRFFMVFLMLVGVSFIYRNDTFVQASSDAPYIKFGDINFDGVINEKDTELMLQHISAVKSDEVYEKHPDWYLKGKAFLAADVNADNKIDTTDTLLVQRHIATKKGEKYISNIVTVTLMNEAKTIVYDCFPVIYYWGDTSKNRYPYLCKPSKSGYGFKGWYLNVYPYGSRVESYGFLAGTDDHILYARWESNSYWLNFDANGGSCSTAHYTLKCGDSYGSLPVPTRLGYTFMGWYTKKNGGVKVSSGTKMVAANVTVYAKWKANTYRVNFDSNGGDCKTKMKVVTYQETYGKLPIPIRKGYTFKGWYTKKSGGNKVSSGTKMAAANMTVYAQWRANTYTVNFDPNGGTCKTKAKTVTYGKAYGKLPKVSRKGYTFQGWYTKKSGGKKITAETKVTVVSKQRLYAHWKVSTKIKLNKTTVALRPKQTYQLKATVTGKKGSLKWASSNPKVVSVNSKGKITAKKAGTANITVTVNGVKSICKVTVASSSASLVSLKSLRGKNYSYKNSKFSFGIGFAESSDYVYIGVWNVSGTSSSYEDFLFQMKEGTYSYRQEGMRSHYIYDITIKPYKDYVKISLKCQNSSYSYFNISGQKFKKTTNATYSHYAELYSIVEIKNYLHGAGGANTVYYTQQLVNAIGGMKTGRNAKYPDLYFTGNNMVIGVNNNPVFNTSKDEYVRIENNGNTAVLFYGVKIGDTRSEMESKFAKYNIKTWDNGKTYSNANGWELKVTFQDGKLKKYIYLCKPTS